MRGLRVLVVAACALVAPVLGACSSDGTAVDGRATTPAAAGKALRVPDVQLTDVATGTKVTLRSQVASDRPTLLWAWAPY